MRHRRLGPQGPEISVVGYGAWEIGGQFYGPNPPKEEVIDAVRAALDAGMNWVDTAEIYGMGRSEELVGEAIRGRGEEVLVATKVAPAPTGTGYEPAQVRRAVRASLRRVGVDHLALYQLHWFPDEETCPVEETWGAMGELVDEGLVRCIGVSNFTQAQIDRCLSVRRVDSVQLELSMLERTREALAAWCGPQGIAVLAYGPLAYGLLTGALTPESRFHPSDFRSGSNPDHPYYRRLFARGRVEAHLAVVERLRAPADRLGISVAQLALAWCVHRPGVTAAIAGSRSIRHNRENARAGDVSLPPEAAAEVDAILSGRA